jgi:hypothetical protein
MRPHRVSRGNETWPAIDKVHQASPRSLPRSREGMSYTYLQYCLLRSTLSRRRSQETDISPFSPQQRHTTETHNRDTSIHPQSRTPRAVDEMRKKISRPSLPPSLFRLPPSTLHVHVVLDSSSPRGSLHFSSASKNAPQGPQTPLRGKGCHT